MLNAPLLDDARLVSEIEMAVATWGSLSVIAFAERIPIFLSIVHTLLDRTHYLGLGWDQIFINNDWLVGYAPCAVNEGPIFTRNPDQPRLETLKSLPGLDQESIHNHLRAHFLVSLADYERDKGTAQIAKAELSTDPEENTMSESSNPVFVYMLAMLKDAERKDNGNLPERAAAAAEICRWGQEQGLPFYLSRDNWLYLCLPENGATLENFVTLKRNGRLAIEMKYLAKKRPFNDKEKRKAVLDTLNAIESVHFEVQRVDRIPTIDLHTIADPATINKVTGVLEKMLTVIQSYRQGQ